MSPFVVGLISVLCIGFPQQGIAVQSGPGQFQSVLSTSSNGHVLNQNIIQQRVTYRPSAGIIISADAAAIFKNAMNQSWNCTRDQFGKRCVQAKTLSKVDYKIKPYPSFDGALLKICMEGASSGESTASRGEKQTIVMDTLTKFKSRQMMMLRTSGIEYGPLDLQVKAAQSFNRAQSDNPLATPLIKKALKKPSDNLQQATNEFAKKQTAQHIYDHLALTCQKGVTAIQQTFARIPILQSYDWMLSSDDKFIYASADHFDAVNSAISPTQVSHQQHPLSVTFNSQFINRLVNDNLSNSKFGSLGIEKQYDQISRFIQLPKLETGNDQDWTIQLGEQPATITFNDNDLRFEIQTREISSTDNSIQDMVIGFSYQPMKKHGFWYLVRSGGVSVREAGDNGQQLGARQTGFRTVMRKRLERVIPKYFAIKQLTSDSSTRNALDLELTLDKIRLSSGQLYLGFQTR